jgi:hypothetical protein
VGTLKGGTFEYFFFFLLLFFLFLSLPVHNRHLALDELGRLDWINAACERGGERQERNRDRDREREIRDRPRIT